MTATEVIFRSGRKRKPTSALLPHGSCATMASPVVQVIFVDESEFENEGNWYFSEHKSVEWEIHSTISQSTSSLGEFSDSEEVESNTDTSSDDNSSDCETSTSIPDCDNYYGLHDSDVMQMVRPEVRAIYLKLHTTDS